MSGGHFKCSNYVFNRIAEQIEQIVETSHDEDDYEYEFGDDTIEKLRDAVFVIKMAGIYMQRVDYLLSNDDSEESFAQRLREELAEMNEMDQKARNDWRDRYCDRFIIDLQARHQPFSPLE